MGETIAEMVERLCPDGVEWVRLGDVSSKPENVDWRKEHSPLQYVDLSSVEMFTGRFTDVDFVNSKSAPSRAQRRILEGDILFATTRPTQMRFARVDQTLHNQVASTGYCVLRPDSVVLESDYLFYVLQMSDFQTYVNRYQTEGNYPSISDALVRSYAIPIPPLEIQREIVRILDAYSAAQQELEEQLQAEVEARETQLWALRRSILENVVDGLETQSLEFVCEKVSAGGDKPVGTVKGQLEPTKEAPYPVFANGTGEDALYGHAPTFSVRNDSVTISARGTIGHHAVRKAQFTPIIRLITLQPKTGIITAEYLNYALYTTELLGSPSSISQLTIPMLKKVEIAVPDIEKQNAAVSTLQRLEEAESDLIQELEAEITARRTQYETFREQLLTFPRKEVAA